MDEHLRSENRGILSTVSAAISFPYIWMGLFLLLSLMYGVDFFGEGFGGGLVAGLLCLGLLNPFVPGLISSFVVKPIISNLLGREAVTASGCVTGLVSVAVMGLAILFFITRDPQVALIIFMAAPVVGGILAIIITIAGRGNFSLPRRGGIPPTSPRITTSHKPALPERTKTRPALPNPRGNKRRLPSPRRPSNPNKRKRPPRRMPPPRR